MDNWRVAVLGDGGVGKTALAVQVSILNIVPLWLLIGPFKFTLNCFVGESSPSSDTGYALTTHAPGTQRYNGV